LFETVLRCEKSQNKEMGLDIMPIYLLVGAAQILFILHAARTGRPYYWMLIILAIPMFGILAYVVFELLPGASQSPASRRAIGSARRIINPEGDYRALAMQLEETPTVANKRALADECVRLGRLDEAERLYGTALVGLHATDPYLMLGMARIRFAQGDPAGCLATLADLRAANPDFQSPDAHMLYARALEGMSRTAEALAEYDALSQYFGGEEPRVRRALLLRQTGDIEAARVAFTEIKRSVERAPAFYRRNQREWYRVAEQNLKG
jgi:hypothetical protein